MLCSRGALTLLPDSDFRCQVLYVLLSITRGSRNVTRGYSILETEPSILAGLCNRRTKTIGLRLSTKPGTTAHFPVTDFG